MIERAFYWYVADKQPKATWQYTESFGIHKKEKKKKNEKKKNGGAMVIRHSFLLTLPFFSPP